MRATTPASEGTPLRPPSGGRRTRATISGVIGAPKGTPLSSLVSSGRFLEDAIDGAHDQRTFEGNRVSTGTPGNCPKGMSRPLEAAPSGSIGLRGRTFHTGPPAEATSAITRLLYANRSIGSIASTASA
jgi:hypothetical protein